MSEKLKESLSAVVDGEADEFELRRVLDEIDRDPELAACWERYHLIGAAIRHEPVAATLTMRDQVWAEVYRDSSGQAQRGDPARRADEPASRAPGSRRVLSLAAAAAVALVIGVGFLRTGPGPSETAPALETAAVDAGQPLEATPAVVTSPPGSLNLQVSASDRMRTEAYIIRHAQQLGMNRPGIGFAKMVAYQRD